MLKAAKEAGANALITAGGFTVDGITLFVEGEANVQNGITLKDAVAAGCSGDRAADVLTITETNATTVNGGTLQNLTVNITGAVHNYLVNWSGGNFLVENAVLSASGNTNGCGIFVGGGTAGCKFHAVNSDVSFSNNVQGDGGRGNNAALDAYGYHIIANNNGAIGLNISKLNAGTEYSSLQQCIVEANGNKGSGLYIYGQSLTLGEDCDLVLQGNGNSGLNVTKGLVDLSAGSVTITGNHTTAKGGGINNADTLYLPENAVVYNNHADKAGDDIYSKELKEGKSIRFCAVGSDWVLDDCGHLIDGWYVDSDQDANEDGYPERRSAHSAPIFTQVYEGFGTDVTVEIALKAAHSEYKLTVYPEDQTKYTGGSDGDEENNQFPHPIYLTKDENGNVSEASAKTFLVNGEGAYAPEDLFSVKYYNDAGEEITSDQRYGDYIARIVLHDEFVGKWITTTDGIALFFDDLLPEQAHGDHRGNHQAGHRPGWPGSDR